MAFLALFVPCKAFAAVGGEAGRDTRIIQLYEIAGIGLRVPVGFLRSIELPPDNGVRLRNRVGDDILFHAVAPAMVPPPHDLKAQWKGGKGYPPYVTILVKAILPDIREEHRSSIMRDAVRDGKCLAKAPGDVCPDPRDLPFENDRQTLFTGGDMEFVFCDKIGAFPFPHCEITRLLFDGVTVEAVFDRRLLDFSDPVWERIYDLVCSWVDLPSDRTLTINRCRATGVTRPN